MSKGQRKSTGKERAGVQMDLAFSQSWLEEWNYPWGLMRATARGLVNEGTAGWETKRMEIGENHLSYVRKHILSDISFLTKNEI